MSKLRFLIIILFTISSIQLNANTQYSFLKLDNLDGLVNNQVTCFFKDSRGFVWIGTTAGLSRFDGTEFVNYKHSIGDTSSIVDNYIETIQEDKKGNLWIETRDSYVVYLFDQEHFITNIDDVLGIQGISSEIELIYVDEQKNFWIKRYSKQYAELYNYEKKVLEFPWPMDKQSKHSIVDFVQAGSAFYYLFSNGEIQSFNKDTYQLLNTDNYLKGKLGVDSLSTRIFVDNEDDIWFYANYNGIQHYKSRSNTWEHYDTRTTDIKLCSNIVTKIIQDEKGKIWIGTDHGGINILNKYSGEIKLLQEQPDNEKSLSQNSITDLYLDDKGIVWVGTYKKGICYYHESVYKFPHYQYLVSDPSSLPYNDVNCFVEDKKGNLWIGTNGGGLIYFDRQKKNYKVYTHQTNKRNSLCNNVIVSLYIDDKGLLWIGTFTGGLDRFDGANFKHFIHDEENKFSLPNNNIWSITQVDPDQLIIGTLGGGVVQFDKRKEVFKPLENNGSIEPQSPFVLQIYKLKNGNLFMATANGVAFYDVKEKRYKHHPVKNLKQALPLTIKSINAVLEDSRGLLWIASREGLTVLNPNTDFIKNFTAEDGLPEDIMKCLLEDEYQSIWISKSNGLSQVVVNQSLPGEEYSFSIYDYTKEDGLQGKEFNTQSAYKTSKNELIFGGANGFNMFQPKNIKYNRELPKVVFTKLQVFNETVKPNLKINNKILLTKSLTSTDTIQLKHSMNVFTIGFSALDFFIPSKMKFKFKLEGFDNDWREAGELREVTYTNLNAGSYTLKVKAANNDGLWNHDYAELHVTVLPPFYATPWAYSLYILIILLILAYLRYSMLRKERLKFTIEQERIQAKRNHEMDEMKLRFLTNVSHEFRTPLTLILTPLDRLLKKVNSESDKKLLQTIDRNAKHLLGLVNQLLDFRKLELHGLRYNPSYGDVVHFLQELNTHFKDEFAKKNITYSFEKNMEHFMFNFDREKLQKVMMNLLSNALKFTPEKGKVVLHLDIKQQEGIVEIGVKDSGVGIEESELENIFVRFYQSENNKKLGLSGSGIGLNLAKEMVQLHNGTIRVESKKGEGAHFMVTLPLDQTIIEPGVEEKEEIADESLEEPVEGDKKSKEKPVILLVEDNVDFRTFMHEALEDRFIIYEAQDGSIGLDKVHKVHPDLIISDVMMPNMDGLELCKSLREDIRTSHIPIILLTARTADEDKIKGLEIGADDYITKPFNMDLLLLRIDKLLEKRSKFQKKFQKNVDISPSDIQITSMDEKLIKKAVALVEKNISESKFSVEDLSRELGMSRVYLYKKLLAITGKSPVEFMRIIRLKRGAQLLEKSQMNVAEVAYEVGFNSPRYFSKYFKEEYGMLPTAYVKKSKKE